MSQPSEAATSLADALKQIKQLTSDLATEKQRVIDVQNEASLRVGVWKEAHSHLSELHENRKQDDLKKLQDAKREHDELAEKLLLKSNYHHQKIQELKSQNEFHEKEVSDMAATIFDLRREKSSATQRAEQYEHRIKNLQLRLDASLNCIERAGRKRDISDAGDEHRYAPIYDIYCSMLTEVSDTVSALANHNMDGTINTAKKARLASLEVVVPCTQCYTKGWPCDNGDAGGSCRNCQLRQKSAVCKRVMCKDYDGDNCM